MAGRMYGRDRAEKKPKRRVNKVHVRRGDRVKVIRGNFAGDRKSVV